MTPSPFFPFGKETDRLHRHSKLALHSGVGSIVCHGDPSHPWAITIRQAQQAMGNHQPEAPPPEFAADFLVPATGNCHIFLRWSGDCPLSQNFGMGLTVHGDSLDGPFRLSCPAYYVRATSGAWEKPGWAVAVPCNQPAVVTYGEPRPVARVMALINNFDFDYGNLPDADRRTSKRLRVEAAGRTVEFAWRENRIELRRLIDAGIFRTTALVTFSFEAWPEATDEELTTFAFDVASLLAYVVGQHTGIPILSFLDAEGRVVRQVLREAIESPFRPQCALPALHFDNGLHQLFRQGFDEHQRMQRTDLWRRLPWLYAAIEDPPYLEQNYATLMMGVELLIRNSLIEGRMLTREQAGAKLLPALIGAARGTLRWDVPKHYTEEERYRTVRNAVDHGNQLPHPPDQVREDFDKWRLFLLRRIFIRLGFDGPVESPQRGFSSSSNVGEFSEEHNSFRR